MGQINSIRNAARTQTNPEPVATQASIDVEPPNETSDRPEARLRTGRRDRRKSLRNCIAGLVNPRSSRTSDGDANPENIGRRKWWPGRRRRSVVQLTRRDASPGDSTSSDIPPQARTAVPPGRTVGSTSIDDSRPPVQSTHTNGTTDGPTSSSAEERKETNGVSLKGKRCTEVSDDSQNGNAVSSRVTNVVDNSVSAEASGSSSSEQCTPLHQALQIPIDDNTQAAASPSLPRDSASEQPPRNSFLRQFPPTGTLVVVQGVVHADNIPRATQDSPPSFFNPGRNSTPDSQWEQLDPELAQHNEVSPSETPEFQSSSSATPGSETTTNSFGTLSDSSSSIASSDNEGNSISQDASPGNSPSNADILGALLSIVSVATAATAASLLSNANGRPMPLPLSDRGSAPTRSSMNGSNLPLIARALASANPAGAAIVAQRQRDREERERNRARSIWEGLRDRVSSGRGNRSPPETGSSSHSSTMHSPDDRLNDVYSLSDSLLNELARAFNLGLTPNERPSDARTTLESSEHGSSNAEEAADNNPTEEQSPGSFEQFLVDLQADLRATLTRPDSDVGSVGDHESRANGADEDPRQDNNATVQSNAEDMQVTTGDEPTAPEQGPTRSSTSTFFDVPESIVENSAAESSMHPLCSDNADRDSSSDNADVPDSSALEPSAVSGPGVTRNGINWWRMYRFPPMRPIQSRTSSSTQATPIPAPIAPISSAPTADSDNPSADGSSRRGETNVIPVIIVGLQSMNAARRRVPPPRAFNPLAGTTDSSEQPGRQAPEIINPEASADSRADRSTWSSRAARTFGRLGRRAESMTARGHEASNSYGGSRSFLIYVFGGHYPPDHHLLSGRDEMDSFEALWELAEFLGQVKAPVVTEEEIERSGLELFKAAFLKEYESSGRVASNCVDRCLICLDDYNPDDDLRLMACKHTFHKSCVDRWLKTGRNNCPACRSEGVKAGGAPRSSQ